MRHCRLQQQITIRNKLDDSKHCKQGEEGKRFVAIFTHATNLTSTPSQNTHIVAVSM